jgi:hypothetical protein
MCIATSIRTMNPDGGANYRANGFKKKHLPDFSIAFNSNKSIASNGL